MPLKQTLPDTRDRILLYLHENSLINVPEVSKIWGLTRADIRYHLNKLAQEGVVEPVTLAGPSQSVRGRPVKAYRLAIQSLDNNYFNLCKALLDTLVSASFPEESSDIFNRLADQIIYLAPDKGNPTQKINLVVKKLNLQGYHARWEAAVDGPRIMFFNCPYANLLSSHPELCRIDQQILERSLGLTVIQTTRINHLTGVPRSCTFRIRFTLA
jgi:predicted ArsR family transcriptional regulator